MLYDTGRLLGNCVPVPEFVTCVGQREAMEAGVLKVIELHSMDARPARLYAPRRSHAIAQLSAIATLLAGANSRT